MSRGITWCFEQVEGPDRADFFADSGGGGSCGGTAGEIGKLGGNQLEEPSVEGGGVEPDKCSRSKRSTWAAIQDAQEFLSRSFSRSRRDQTTAMPAPRAGKGPGTSSGKLFGVIW